MSFRLDYLKDDKVRPELMEMIKKINETKPVNEYLFFASLNELIKTSSKSNIEFLATLAQTKPYHLLGLIYYLLKDDVNVLNKPDDYEYLCNYIDCEVDLFMITNFVIYY